MQAIKSRAFKLCIELTNTLQFCIEKYIDDFIVVMKVIEFNRLFMCNQAVTQISSNISLSPSASHSQSLHMMMKFVEVSIL